MSNVPGIVTAKLSNGFYMQDPNPDSDDSTSEAIFVFTSSAPTVNVGDSVTVNGTVIEFRPGGSSSANLTTTEISSPIISVQSTGRPNNLVKRGQAAKIVANTFFPGCIPPARR